MAEPEQAPFLSLVIPAYNEASRLPLTLTQAQAYLERQSFATEVLVIDDGSTDGTAAIVRERAVDWPALRLIATAHRGKGHAVRVGLLASCARYVFLCDADLSMPITELDRFTDTRLGEFDVAIASREAPGARRYNEPFYRHLMGRVFNAFVRWMVLPGVQDSQCGFKCLRGSLARELAGVQTIDGWGFDVELLTVARQWGFRIVEVPIPWHHVRSSRIRPVRDTWRMVREVMVVRRNLRRGVYARPALPEVPEPQVAEQL